MVDSPGMSRTMCVSQIFSNIVFGIDVSPRCLYTNSTYLHHSTKIYEMVLCPREKWIFERSQRNRQTTASGLTIPLYLAAFPPDAECRATAEQVGCLSLESTSVYGEHEYLCCGRACVDGLTVGK